ncbi:Protein N-acetyltransferase, RimJ/RimL family [Lachnospiraceae bacterium NE2001]|nr:Protein N-acetyltransferase, RimJ/RimL family [Lachnospiraceae bacterium NE2001]
MILRKFEIDSDFEAMKDWVTDEKTHAMWCANLIKYPLSKEHLAETLKEVSNRFGDVPYVAITDDDKVAGFFCYSFNNETKEGMLKFVVVDPEARGKGVARDMLGLAIEQGFENPEAIGLQLNVFPENLRAKKCYEKAGFIERNLTPNAFTYKDESWGRCNMVFTREIINPWKEISLDDYENHMSLDSVKQLQTLNSMMKLQLSDYDASTAMILGVAGGNGLEHIDKNKYKKVYGVDINEDYLQMVSERYSSQDKLGEILECIPADLTKNVEFLPTAELVIADLLIEYIGYEAFTKAVEHIKPEVVSCIIQINTDTENWVSDSPYLHAFDGLDAVHHQMEENALRAAMESNGYTEIKKVTEALPNGKALVRVDFQR